MCLVDYASVSFGGSGQNSGQLRVGSVNRWATQDKPEPGMAHTVQIIFIGASVGGCGCMHTGSPGGVAGRQSQLRLFVSLFVSDGVVVN